MPLRAQAAEEHGAEPDAGRSVAVGGDDVEVDERGRVLFEDPLDAADAAAGVGARPDDEDPRPGAVSRAAQRGYGT